MKWIHAVVACLLTVHGTVQGQVLLEHPFTIPETGEAVATITAGCERCHWGTPGREAVALKLSIDGSYSQHVLLTRGEGPADYAVVLGPLAAGRHRLTFERDRTLSATDAGEAHIDSVSVESFGPDAAEHSWLSMAPVLHARPGTVERFSDVPLMMYAETTPGTTNGYVYTVIFSHEDGGTPTDRLMATWGRSTDIEFVYRIGPGTADAPGGEYQGVDHEIVPFRGRREGAHPLLWVSTDNNMVSDSGPETAIRFALAPRLVTLDEKSREAVMDGNPWLYEVMSAELAREGRIDGSAPAGSGKVADPRTFAYLEACGDLQEATIAFDIAVRGGDADTVWHATDRGDPRFRIARSGCFRAAVPLPVGTAPPQIAGLRARAYTRPARDGEPALPSGTGRVVLRRLNTVFMLGDEFKPVDSGLRWTGTLELQGESLAAAIPATAR